MKIKLIVGGSVLMTLLIVLGVMVWLHITVKNGMIRQLQEILYAQAKFDELHLNLFTGEVRAERGTLLSINPDSHWKQATFGRATATFNLLDLFAPTAPVELDLSEFNIIMGKPAPETVTGASGIPIATATRSPTTKKQWPNLNVHHFSFHQGSVSGESDYPVTIAAIEGAAEKKSSKEEWLGSIRCGKVDLLNIQCIGAKGTYSVTPEEVKIDAYTVKIADGTVTGNATLPRDQDKPSHVHFEFHDVPLESLTPAKWRTFLTGNLGGQGDYDGPILPWTEGKTNGHLQVASAVLKALPFLDKLAFIPGMGGLGRVSLDDAQTDFTFEHGTFEFSNLNMEKKPLLDLRGGFKILRDGTLSGAPLLGLPDGPVGLIPKLKESIFTRSADGYAFADVNISGTAEHLQEDLSARLLTFALQQGKSALDSTIQGASNFLNSLMK